MHIRVKIAGMLDTKYTFYIVRGVRLAKNDFSSVFGSVLQKTAVFGSVSFLLN